jgi:hypothetical protein
MKSKKRKKLKMEGEKEETGSGGKDIGGENFSGHDQCCSKG